MKVCHALVALASISLMAPVSATSLKLSQDVDVIVIDGKQMSGAILKGADSLELDGGQHQILFQVSKNIRSAKQQSPLLYHSPALIVTFSAKGSRSVSFVIPALNNEKEAGLFSQKMNYQLVDDKGREISSQRDVLNLFNPVHTADAEKLMISYNLSGGRAAVPFFAQEMKERKSASTGKIPSQISLTYLHPLWTRITAHAGIERLLFWLKLPEKQEQPS